MYTTAKYTFWQQTGLSGVYRELYLALYACSPPPVAHILFITATQTSYVWANSALVRSYRVYYLPDLHEGGHSDDRGSICGAGRWIGCRSWNRRCDRHRAGSRVGGLVGLVVGTAGFLNVPRRLAKLLGCRGRGIDGWGHRTRALFGPVSPASGPTGPSQGGGRHGWFSEQPKLVYSRRDHSRGTASFRTGQDQGTDRHHSSHARPRNWYTSERRVDGFASGSRRARDACRGRRIHGGRRPGSRRARGACRGRRAHDDR
jgi:hypothetical protein